MRKALASLLAIGVAIAPVKIDDSSAQVSISEVRIDQPGADTDEYFELNGAPGLDLSSYTYLVIGDGAGGSGVIESATSLDGLSIPADGFFLAVEETFTLNQSSDVMVTLNFENGDNVTHLVVTDFVGATGQDLDDDDDGDLDVTPWSLVTDCVAMLESAGSGDQTYCGASVGPESGVPWHIFQDGGWQIGPRDPASGLDTPGGPVSGLPVELGTFRALLTDSKVIVKWTTLSEHNNAGFEVELLGNHAVRKSTFVAAREATGSDYHLELNRPPPGMYTYRLVQLDRDGTSSPIATAALRIPVAAMFLVDTPFPNPVQSSVSFTVSSQISTQRVSAILSDDTGRVVRRLFGRTIAAGESHRSTISVEGLAVGRYYIHVEGSGLSSTRPIVVVQ